MQLFEGYSADELHRALTVSRWLAGLLFLGGIITLIVNQWLVHRIAEAQKDERVTTRERLVQAEEELRRMRTKTTEVVNTFDKLTSSRKLSATQLPSFITTLEKGEKGKVIVTYLTVEWDAEGYARQLTNVLKEAGIEATLSDHLWVDMDENDIFLVAKDKNPPALAQNLQRAFESTGILVPFFSKPEIAEAVGATSGETVLVVSNRPDSPTKAPAAPAKTAPSKEQIRSPQGKASPSPK
jgi:hypothetical protein